MGERGGVPKLPQLLALVLLATQLVSNLLCTEFGRLVLKKIIEVVAT